MKSFRKLEKILRFSLKVRGNTGNIFVQLNVALQVENHCWPYYQSLQTSPRKKRFSLQVEKNCWKWVDASWTCCATCSFNFQKRNFVVWHFLTWVVNTCNNAFQLGTRNNVSFASCSNLLLVLLHGITQLGSSFETLDIAFRTSAVHQPCAFRFVFLHCLRRTPNVNCTN